MYSIDILEDKRAVRWTSSACELRVKVDQKTLPKLMWLRLGNIRYPDEGAFLVDVNGREVIRSTAKESLDYSVNLPALKGADELVISITTPKRTFPGDHRELGILIESLAIE